MLQFMRVLSLCVLLYPVLYIGLIALLPTLLPAIAWGPILFRVVFSLASGPLALSALAFRHGFVFNSVNYWALWTVHIGPALSVFGESHAMCPEPVITS